MEICGIVQNFTKPDKQSVIKDVQDKARQAVRETKQLGEEEDALYGQTAPAKRIKLILKPKAKKGKSKKRNARIATKRRNR